MEVVRHCHRLTVSHRDEIVCVCVVLHNCFILVADHEAVYSKAVYDRFKYLSANLKVRNVKSIFCSLTHVSHSFYDRPTGLPRRVPL